MTDFVSFGIFLVKSFSYAGIFLASFLSTSTIFFPFPLYLIIFFSASLGLNTLIVGLLSGLGSSLGELTGYFVGVGGGKLIENIKPSKFVKRIVKYFDKYGFLVIFLAALLPFPFDIVGIMSGVAKYDIKKFLAATFLGKTIKSLLIAYAGYLVLPIVTSWLL